MMSGKQCRSAERAEGITDASFRCLLRQTLPPEGAVKMNPQLVNSLFRAIGPEPRASNVLTAIQQKDGPILDTTLLHLRDLLAQAFAHLLFGEWSSNERGNFGISPEFSCQV
jgi:hypothetical protein